MEEKEITISKLATTLKEGQSIPFGIKKDFDGEENFVILLKDSKKKTKQIAKNIKDTKIYRIVMPIKSKERTFYISLILISFSDNLKYLTYITSDKELYSKSLTTERVTIVVSDGKLLTPYPFGGIAYNKEIPTSKEEISNEEIIKLGTFLNVMKAKKLEKYIDEIYRDGTINGEILDIGGLSIK